MMKHIGSYFFALLFALIAQLAWGQGSSDTTAQPKALDTLLYPTVVGDRINQFEDRERAPSLKDMVKAAKKAFDRKDFYAAMKYYGLVLKSEPLNVEALQGRGESAMEISRPDIADTAFQTMVNHGVSPSPDYLPKMRLAEAKFRKGGEMNYEIASELFDEIATIPQTPPISAEQKAEALARKAICLWALEDHDNLDILQDTATMLGEQVNTREFAEYASFPADDKLYFSAYRFDFKKDKASPDRHLVKLLTVTEKDNQSIITESEFNDPKLQHTAHFAIGESGNTVYYAAGDYLGKSAEIRFDLYRRKKQADGLWGAPEKLDAVNLPGVTTTEPSVGTMPGETKERLFFVSDRPNGKGGRDIWYSHILGDSLTPPQPLIEVNTKGNDVTPFYHAPSNTLYFSTDGLRTLGGFDVYKSRRKAGKWENPKHMGTPINTYANDVYFGVNQESSKAYFSNNLRNVGNNTEEGCCYDIYSVDICTPKLKAIAYHDLTKGVLPLTNVTLYERGASGQYQPKSNPQPEESSTYTFDIELDKSYRLIGFKADFSSDTLDFYVPDTIALCEELVQPLYLRPHVKLIASVYDCETGEPINGAKATFYDLGFRNAAGNFLAGKGGGKAEVLPENTHRKAYEIDFEHKYQVLAEKDGYENIDSSEVVSTLDLTHSDTLYAQMYLCKKEKEFDPIPLFFDNDYPKIARAKIDTNYFETYKFYIAKKDEFKKQYTKDMSGPEKQAALDSIEHFFEREVRAGWDSLFAFSDYLFEELNKGTKITITLKGFASPLAKPAYNKLLTGRRIKSVYDFFDNFDSNRFTSQFYKFYNPDPNGAPGPLTIVTEENGEEKSTYKDPDREDQRKPKASIYDWRASRERRVEIISAKIHTKKIRPQLR